MLQIRQNLFRHVVGSFFDFGRISFDHALRTQQDIRSLDRMLHFLCLTVFAAHADSGEADLHAALSGELTVTELFQFSTDSRKRIRIPSLPGRLYHIHRDPQHFRSFQFLLIPSGASAVFRDHVADIVLLQDSGVHLCGKRSLQCQDLSAFDSLLHAQFQALSARKDPHIQAVMQSAGGTIRRQFLAPCGQQNIALCILQHFGTVSITFKIPDTYGRILCFRSLRNFPFQTQVNGKLCFPFRSSQCIHGALYVLCNDPGIRVGCIHYDLIALVTQKFFHLLPVHSATVKRYKGLPLCPCRLRIRLFPHHDLTIFRCHAYGMRDSGICQDFRQPPSFCGSCKNYYFFHPALHSADNLMYVILHMISALCDQFVPQDLCLRIADKYRGEHIDFPVP